MLFPDDYVNNITERLNLYTKLNKIKEETELLKFQKALEDRFGELPKEVFALLDSVRIKWIAMSIGLERVIMKQGRFIGYFISDQQSDFYQTEAFSSVLKFVQTHPQHVKMTEKNTRNGLRLLLSIEKTPSVSKALEILQHILA